MSDSRFAWEFDVTFTDGEITAETDPVDALTTILSESRSEFFTTKPEIYKLHETTPAGRENQRTDAAYILESAGTELNRFGVTPGTQDAQTEDGQVQIYVYSLDNQSAKITAQEIVAYLREFLSDNYFGTNFLNIEPTNISDRRASSIARQTDHYVYVVDIQTERLS